MKNMEVLLREPVKNLGIPGDVVKVAAGYARNYLLPQRIAVQATEHNKLEVAKKKAEYEVMMAERAKEIEAMIASFAGVSVTTTERSDAKGSLYGSVNAARIVELLAEQGKQIEERQVRLEGPIKKVGTHEVQIHIMDDKNATVTVIVESLDGVTEAEEEPTAEGEAAPEAATEEGATTEGAAEDTTAGE